ncbi:metal-dependent hydrolase [Cytobacillus sp. Hm23]
MLLTLISEVGYHGAVGAFVAYLIGRRYLPEKKLFLFMFIGVIAGIAPDLTLIFEFAGGVLSSITDFPVLEFLGVRLYFMGHSIFVAPAFSLGLAVLIRPIFPELTLKIRWMSMFFSIVIGHLFMDFLDNGLPLFFPITYDRDIGLNVLNGSDGFLVLSFSVLFALILFLHKTGRQKWAPKLIIVGVVLLASYGGVREMSKTQMTKQLAEQYPGDKVYIEAGSGNPFSSRLWHYEIRSNSDAFTFIIYGEGSFSNLNESEQERLFLTDSGYTLLLREITIEDQLYLIGIPYNIGESSYNFDVGKEDLLVYKAEEEAEELKRIEGEEKDSLLNELPSLSDEAILFEKQDVSIKGIDPIEE